MVTRKPVPGDAPVDPSAVPRASIQDGRQEPWPTPEPEPDADGVWVTQDQTQGNEARKANSLSNVPDALRPGVAPVSYAPDYSQNEENPWGDNNGKLEAPPSVEEKAKLNEIPRALMPGVTRNETNPFKRKPVGNTPAMPSEAPRPPPTDALTQMQINEPESSTNPWQPAVNEGRISKSSSPLPPVSDPDQESGKNVWESKDRPTDSSRVPATNSPPVPSLPSGSESHVWDEDKPPNPSLPPLPAKSPEQDQFIDDQHAWDDVGLSGDGKQPAGVSIKEPPGPPDGWNLIDHDTLPEPSQATLLRQESWENFSDGEEDKNEPAAPMTEAAPAPAPAPVPAPAPEPEPEPAPAPAPEPPPPALPPRTSTETAPPRPQPQSKSETYQIKNINWFDDSIKTTRKSPILVQNANGPCPLVALVNGLTLTVPAGATSNLVETLRTREQISINLLLEAVFDELISSRRTNPDAALPDMTELYDFLKGLQTGMNVNPRFIPTPERVDAYHQKSPDAPVPGTFEDTRDLKLYATFSVPLIHGWLPPRDDPAYDAFTRQGSSYDEVQSLLFREEELEDKLSNTSTGLTEREQQLYQDIITIKSWFSSTATQLTPWGLDVIARSIQPGSFAILFRNDHFSTLYRHPQTLELLTLVTDAGYFTHDEIVWESLSDVRGERAEFFSGDFRIVSGPQQPPSSGDVPGAWHDEGSTTSANGGEWQTVQSRRSRNNHQAEMTESSAPPRSPNQEQEDRDLALALQLQEDEEARHHAAQAARRREAELSEQFIEQQGRQGPPAARGRGGGAMGARGGSAPPTPPRTTSANHQRGGRGGTRPVVQHVRPLVPPVTTTQRPGTHRPADADVDDAPPSYEQASKSTPYLPPAGHPSHPSSSPGGPSNSNSRTDVSTGAGRGGPGPASPLRGWRVGGGGTSVPAGNGGSPAQANGGRDRDCVVM
ncbi:hypothetical protein DL764_003143 [Monosporascus ibericus]|uniref:MINDY deubiquitinase domain-containing protein n=1 Tax=Monosporascus ibericus TaxID=155417 RepID=A0A4Q4TJI7_9PEZI|nr:hypothetical protein DL764_003143 [Monosporascus ibericus]